MLLLGGGGVGLLLPPAQPDSHGGRGPGSASSLPADSPLQTQRSTRAAVAELPLQWALQVGGARTSHGWSLQPDAGERTGSPAREKGLPRATQQGGTGGSHLCFCGQSPPSPGYHVAPRTARTLWQSWPTAALTTFSDTLPGSCLQPGRPSFPGMGAPAAPLPAWVPAPVVPAPRPVCSCTPDLIPCASARNALLCPASSRKLSLLDHQSLAGRLDAYPTPRAVS